MERRERKNAGRKKTFVLLLAFTLILTSAVLPGNENLLKNAVYAATSGQITLEASLTTLNDRTSDKVALTIGVKENATEGMSGLQFQLQYPKEFTLIETQEGDFFKGGVSFYGETDANPLFCGFGSHGSDENREESTDKPSGKLVTFIFEANTALTRGQEYAFKILDEKRAAFLLTSCSAGTPETVYFNVVNADTSIYSTNGNGGEITTEEGTTKIKAEANAQGTAVVKQQLIAETLASGGDAIIDLTSGTAAKAEVEISKTAADLVAGKGKSLIVQTNGGLLNFNTAAMASINKNAEGENLLISVIKEDSIAIGEATMDAVNFNVTAKLVNNTGEFIADVTNFGGGEVEVALNLPSSLRGKAVKCWNYTDTNYTPVEGTVKNNQFVFKTKHFSKYIVAEKTTLDAFKVAKNLSEGVTVSGTVTSWNNVNDTVIRIYSATMQTNDIKKDIKSESPNLGKAISLDSAITTNAKRFDQKYSVTGVANGEYVIAVYKPKHAVYITSNLSITGNTVQNIELYLLGDVNKSGSVNATDAMLTLRNGKSFNGYLKDIADVNGSGSVNATDAMLILRYKPTKNFPIEEEK